jgi:hypothetical protein
MTQSQFDVTPNDNIQQLTGQAAHLMWLQRQLVAQWKNERTMRLAFGLSVVFDVIVIIALFTFLRDLLELPEIATYLVVGGLALEMALLAFLAQRTSKRRQAIQDEIELITRGYTQS